MTADHLGPRVDLVSAPFGRMNTDPEAYAYLFEWSPYYAPRTLHRLLEADFRPRLATEYIALIGAD